MKRRIRAAVLGYYGRWNVGDDLMARDVAQALTDAGREVRIVAGNPYLYNVVNRPNVSVAARSLASLVQTLAWCDELIFAGGTIFHDSFTNAEFEAYHRHLKLYVLLFRVARWAGKPVRFLGIGLGPFRRESARDVTRSALSTASAIYVRDAASLEEATTLQPLAKPVLGPDLAFLGAAGLIERARARAPQHRLGLSVLDMTAFLPDAEATVFWAPLRDAIAKKLEADPALRLTIFAFWTAPARRSDRPVAERFSEGLPAEVRERTNICAYAGDPDVVIDAVADCKAIVATRFHAAVLAQALKRPYAVIAYHRKVSDFADVCGLSEDLRLPGDRVSDPTRVHAMVDALLGAEWAPAVDTSAMSAAARTAVALALGSKPILGGAT